MAEQRAPDMAQAQEREFMVGARWLNWRNDECTQEFVAWIRQGLVGTAQDAWANGGFASHDAGLIAQGGANALLRLAVAVENIRMDDQQENNNDE